MILKHKKLIIILVLVLSLFIVHTYRNRDLVTTYTSKYHNYTLTFPGSWHGKYKINEQEDSLSVCLNTFGYIDLFTITTNTSETLDSIANVEKIQNINGENFMIGGPTDNPYSSFTSAKTRARYAKLRYEIPQVISSIK